MLAQRMGAGQVEQGVLAAFGCALCSAGECVWGRVAAGG